MSGALSRMHRASSRPSISGSLASRKAQANRCSLHQLQGFLGRQGFAGDITPFVEEMFQGPAHIRLIVHNENQFAWISHPTALTVYKMGNLTVKVLPWSAPLSTVMVPKCCLMME